MERSVKMAENINQNQNEVKPFSWWERLKYVFISPSKVFENIKEHPRVLFPMLVILIGMLIINLLMINVIKDALRDEFIRQASLSGQEVTEEYINFLVTSGVIGAIIGTVITVVAVWIVKSTLINAFSGFVNGTGRFKQALSVITYSYFPVFIGSIIVTIISLVTKQYNILTSLAVFLPDSQAGTILYSILANLDIFVIWYQVLAIIGISKVYSVSKKSSSILVLGTWIVYILVSSGLGVLGTKIAGLA